MQPGYEFLVALETCTERLSDGFAGEVIFGGSKPSHEDCEVGAREGDARSGDKLIVIIPDNIFEMDLNAKLVQPISKQEGICVLSEGGEQLGANGDDLGVHLSSISH